MILVDTSVFIDHLRVPNRHLAALLQSREVLVHPWVIGELALGHLGRLRAQILDQLATLPAAPVVAVTDVLAMIEAHRIAGSGLNWVDVQLLACCRLAGVPLWTNDRKLASASSRVRAH